MSPYHQCLSPQRPNTSTISITLLQRLLEYRRELIFVPRRCTVYLKQILAKKLISSNHPSPHSTELVMTLPCRHTQLSITAHFLLLMFLNLTWLLGMGVNQVLGLYPQRNPIPAREPGHHFRILMMKSLL